jgi:8-amino-7-oxononanoate synthase
MPERSARLRFYVSCDHTEEQIVSSIEALAQELGRL